MSKKNWDSDWIHFSKRARRGIFVLLFLYVAVAVSPRLYHNYFYTPPDYEIKYSALKKTDLDTLDVVHSRYTQPVNSFDPNTYSIEEWIATGLTERQAKSILKYLSSGAMLKVKADLKKLYVVDDELYALLEPKVSLPDSIVRKSYGEPSSAQKTYGKDSASTNKAIKEDVVVNTEITPISVNKSSSRELQTIPGIGPFFAQEIIKIREKYGGVISADELLDIYKMDEEKLAEILPYLIVDKNEINKLNINTASEEKLRQHPLITRDMAKSIVYFRENHKKYESLNGLLLSPYIDGPVLKRISPYLKVE